MSSQRKQQVDSGTGPVASLPMHDWPEIRGDTDALWHQISAAFQEGGIQSPESLRRSPDLMSQWQSDRLLLGHTCGLPYVTQLQKQVCVVGSFHFDLGCDPGDYYSAVVVRRSSDLVPGDLRQLVGSRVAYSESQSQSGNAAFRHLVAPMAQGGSFFSGAVETGSHRASIQAVASGRADIASIDMVSWLLATDHEPAAADLVVLLTTPPTPGLPLITHGSNRHLIPELRSALDIAITRLAEQHRRALHLLGFRPREVADYEVIRDHLAESRRLGYSSLR